jgi:DNA-binding transcriptional LysR family regulator
MLLLDERNKNASIAVDINQATTFLEIARTGSFVAAAARLNVTQTAVSARVRALEASLGRQLFVRNKSGARLTPAGERFLRAATELVRIWDHAQRQVALPAGRREMAVAGAELSLWNPLLGDWLGWMRKNASDVALHAEVDVPARLLERVANGSLDMAVLYNPPEQREDLIVELLAEEKLVPVSSRPISRDGMGEDFIRIDWGPVFERRFRAAFPDLADAGIVVSHGPLGLLHLLAAGGTGYVRLSAARPHLAEGQLYIVPDAPVFAHPMHLVHSNRADGTLIARMRDGFLAASARHRPPLLQRGRRRPRPSGPPSPARR